MRQKHMLLSLPMALIVSGTAFAHDAAIWTINDDVTKRLTEMSCAQSETYTDFESLNIDVQSVTLNQTGHPVALPAPFTFHGGWEINAAHPDFGGLSGLAIEPDGTLLTVSDKGRFIRLKRKDGALNGAAEITPMRFENPRTRPNKLIADAEGLTLHNGLTFVSFERKFRVLSFALETCGAAARGILVAKLPNRHDGRSIKPNSGPEALWMKTDGTLNVLYEQVREDRIKLGQVTKNGTATLSSVMPIPPLEEGFRPVGVDQISLSDGNTVTASLFRAYDRKEGNRIRLDISRLQQDRPHSLTLDPSLLTDNFEGVALETIEDGVRAWMISDDNFSGRQRTLLYAFDIALDAPAP